MAWRAFLIVFAAWALVACKSTPEWEKGKKYLHFPLRAKVGSLDPVRTSTQYANIVSSQVYDTLFQFSYLVRPYQIEPLLLERMPEVSEDKTTYTFELKKGVLFHDDPCFPGGVGRELVAQDVIWSLMRMADRNLTPSGWWLYEDRIAGLDEFQKRMNKRKTGEPFDWEAKIEGFEVLGKHEFRIKLVRPFPQFLYVLAMGYTAPVPRECAEHYGKEFGNRPVGTGPFILREWKRGTRFVLDRNPKYREVRYPKNISPELASRRDLAAMVGKRVPFLDGMVLHVFEQDQPMWLKFRVGDLDLVQVPAEYHDLVFQTGEDLSKTLRPNLAGEGVLNENVKLLDLIYRGFNMDDPVTGKGEKAKKVRQAISLALDTKEVNDAFYNNTNVLYDGPIPPGLAGHKEGILSPYRGPKLEEARAKLREAGYPDGKGLPPIQFYTSRSGNSAEQAEMLARQMKEVGIQIDVNLSSFPELVDKLKKRKAQMFGLAWGADYPDAENFLQLFYGPNSAPGSNNFNYATSDFDAMYQETRTMQPSPERTAIYEKMRDMIIEDCPIAGSMARTRFYLWNPRMKHVMPMEIDWKWLKYVDVEPRN